MINRLVKFFERFIVWIGIIFGLIVSLLTFFISVHIREYGQELMTIDFAPFILVGILLFVGIILIPPIFKKLQTISVKSMIKFACFWTFLVAFLWILIADVLPMFDSKDLTLAAMAFNGSDDPLAISKWIGDGAYLERFPFQAPLVVFIAILMRLFGSNYLVVFQILNCIAVGFIVYFIIKLSYGYFKNKFATNLTAIVCLFFLPMIFYCTFIYGNLIGIALAFGSWYCQFCFLKHDSHRLRNMLASIILMILAVVFKQTLIIAAIAMAVVWVISGVKDKKYLIAIALVEVLVAYFATPLINVLIERIRPDYNLHSGMPQIAWVAMGLGAGKEYFAEIRDDEALRDRVNSESGYYDGFIYASNSGSYSPEDTTDVSKQYLGIRLKHFREDPGLFMNFMAHKLVVQWTDPTFESLLASNWCINDHYKDYRMCDRNHTVIAEKIYYGKLNQVLIFIMDTVQTVIVFGFLVALFKKRKKMAIWQMAPLICLLGGAFLYIFWESKTQYNLMFYLMMIPYSGVGWSYILQSIRMKFVSWKNKSHKE